MKDVENDRPPRYMLSFFRWFCHSDFREDIEGDLVERFHHRAASRGLRSARRHFVRDVLLLFRPGIIRKLKVEGLLIDVVMLENYLKVAYRIFYKEKAYAVTNILGLAMGISCSLFIYLWLQDELTYNRFFPDSDRVCYVMSNVKMSNGDVNTYHSSPYNLKHVLEETYPEVSQVAVLTWGNWTAFEKNGSLMEQAGIDASPELFEMFEIPFIQGDHKVMYKKLRTIAISESFADSFFGRRWRASSVVGESISTETGDTYEVVGIFADLPKQSTLRFEFVVPFDLYLSKNQWLNEWDNNAIQMYVKLTENVSSAEAGERVRNAVVDHYQGDVISRREIFLQPFSDTYLYNRYKNGAITGGRIEYIYLLAVAAVLVLILAAINFINLSTARAAKRAKETGVRKVLGSHGISLKLQFLTESTMITLLSLMVSLVIIYLLLPQFNLITGKEVSFNFFSLRFVSLLIGLILLLGVLSGLYPAFYLASMKAISSLKGIRKHDRRDVFFRKGLVVFQFVIGIVMITASLTVYRQVEYIQTKDIGMNRSSLIRTWGHALSSAKDYETFKTELLKRPGIESVTMINQNPIDVGQSTDDVNWPGKLEGESAEFYVMAANPDLIPTLGLWLREGRNFDWKMRTDTANFIINEAAQKLMRLEDPVGQAVGLWDVKGRIIGVVQDFHNASLHAPIEPLIIRFDQSFNWLILARAVPGHTAQAITSLEEAYHLFNPKREFKYDFMDDVYDQYYKSEFMVRDLSLYFTILSMFISCLGLFALVAYTAEQRTREIGIRKILGASAQSILGLLSKEFLLLLGIALAVSLPIAFFILDGWLGSFAYQVELSWWVFMISAVVTIVISYAIIGGHAMRSASLNPVDTLRSD